MVESKFNQKDVPKDYEVPKEDMSIDEVLSIDASIDEDPLEDVLVDDPIIKINLKDDPCWIKTIWRTIHLPKIEQLMLSSVMTRRIQLKIQSEKAIQLEIQYFHNPDGQVVFQINPFNLGVETKLMIQNKSNH